MKNTAKVGIKHQSIIIQFEIVFNRPAIDLRLNLEFIF
jgi:hypothetical protein